MTLTARLLDLAVRVQQVPAPTFEEGARAEFVREQFRAAGLQDVHLDAAGNVRARLPGGGTASPVVVSAHLDTVFPAGTDLTVRREPTRIHAPGIGDNSLGLAALFGILWGLEADRSPLPGEVWFVANVCEEGLGDLRGMKHLVEDFGSAPRLYLVVEGMGLGAVYHRGISVRRYRISMHTDGGHSWSDYGKPSAIHELSALVTRLSSLPLPLTPRTTLNVGRISGGTSVNTLAAEAWLELDLRSESPHTLEQLDQQVGELLAAAGRPSVRVESQLIGSRPGGEIAREHAVVRAAADCLMAEGQEPLFTCGSTDANVPLSRGYPSVCLGVTTGGGAHTAAEYIDVAPVAAGLSALTNLVRRAFTL